MTETPAGPLLYRGNVNVWECDEMGHLNVRFYVAKMQEALAVLGAKIGLPPRRLRETGCALSVVDHHIRFLREAHAGAGLSAYGGVVEVMDDGLRVYIELRHQWTNEVAATFNTLVQHTDPDMDARIPLPRDIPAAAQPLMIEVPSYAAPRSLTLDPPTAQASMEAADALNLTTISLGCVSFDQCGNNDRMALPWFMGRISDGIVNLYTDLAPSADLARVPGELGSAVLEYRLCYKRRPKVGDLITVRSGVAEVGEKTIRMVHWILDPASGACLATATALGITLDLKARKAVAIPEERRAVLEAKRIEGLSI